MPARQIYQTLLRLYPRDYRNRFATEMLHAFDETMAERRGQPLPEWIGLMAGAGAEWIAKWTTDTAVRGRSLPDLRVMRPPGVPKELWFGAPRRPKSKECW